MLLNVEFTKESTTKFLLSTRFLFQNLDRVQLYDLNVNLLADTDTLDLAENAFVKSENIQETPIDKIDESTAGDENLKNTNVTIFVSGMSAKARGYDGSLLDGYNAEFAMPDKLVEESIKSDSVLCY